MSTTSGMAIPSGRGKPPLFSDLEIQQIAKGGPGGIAKWVHSTAMERGASIRLTPSDRFARAVTRLSGGAVDLDEVEALLGALKRAGVLTAYQRGLLQQHYLR